MEEANETLFFFVCVWGVWGRLKTCGTPTFSSACRAGSRKIPESHVGGASGGKGASFSLSGTVSGLALRLSWQTPAKGEPAPGRGQTPRAFSPATRDAPFGRGRGDGIAEAPPTHCPAPGEGGRTRPHFSSGEKRGLVLCGDLTACESSRPRALASVASQAEGSGPSLLTPAPGPERRGAPPPPGMAPWGRATRLPSSRPRPLPSVCWARPLMRGAVAPPPRYLRNHAPRGRGGFLNLQSQAFPKTGFRRHGSRDCLIPPPVVC